MDTESTEQLLRIATKQRDAEKQLMDQCEKLTHQARNLASAPCTGKQAGVILAASAKRETPLGGAEVAHSATNKA